MVSFVYNSFQTGKFLDVDEHQRQWTDYVQKREFHDDLTKTLKSSADSYRKELQRNAELANKDASALRQEFAEASERQIDAIRDQARAISESAEMVVGSLDSGFADLSERIENVNSSIENIGMMLDWRLSEVIDQLRISNILNENIALLLRVPDFQKERQYYLEQGFKHYKNAAFDEDLYNDALENLLGAEEREKTDYVVLHRIGMIYLHSAKLGDLTKAEDYFRRAAKYAVVESNPEAQQTLNLLGGDARQSLATATTHHSTAGEVAAGSYFQAGVACYAQGKFEEALNLSSKAFSLLPTLLEAGFLGAKSLTRLGKPEKAVEVLRPLIQTDRFYAIKTVADGDLSPQREVSSLLKELCESAVLQATETLDLVRKRLIQGSQILPFIGEIEDCVAKGTYLDALKALDMMSKKRVWNRPILNLSKVEWVMANGEFSISEFVSIEPEDRKQALRFHQQIILKILKTEEEKKLLNKRRADSQRLAEEKRKQDQIRTRNRTADSIMNEFTRELPRRIWIVFLISVIGWLVIGSGGCILRSLSLNNRRGGGAVDASSYTNEGLTVAIYIGVIGGAVIFIQFILALVQSSSARSSK